LEVLLIDTDGVDPENARLDFEAKMFESHSKIPGDIQAPPATDRDGDRLLLRSPDVRQSLIFRVVQGVQADHAQSYGDFIPGDAGEQGKKSNSVAAFASSCGWLAAWSEI
jgi:hypothetical protein